MPPWEASPAGPFTNWPVGMGFDYFYGFVGGDTSQWQPGNLFRNTTPIHPYRRRSPGWNLITAMADDAIDHIRTQHRDRAAAGPGSSTTRPAAPMRRTTRRPNGSRASAASSTTAGRCCASASSPTSSASACIPANAQLPPWPDVLPRWDSLSADEKRLFIRQVEVYAAYLAYTDHEIGRVIAGGRASSASSTTR